MKDILAHIYNACNPVLPATPEYYVNCAGARGSSLLSARYQQELARVEQGVYLHFLFSGHIGCGKSSELKSLQYSLEKPNRSGRRHFPVFLNTAEYLDEYDASPTDLLLAIVAELADQLRRRAGIELKDSYFAKRFVQLKEMLFTDVSVESAEIGLDQAKLVIQPLQKNPDARKKVRETLFPQTSTLLAEINAVFDEARLALKLRYSADDGYADIVLILDNLEKVQRIGGHEEGAASQRELFIERAPQLTGLNVHVIYTVPLSLVRSHGSQLGQIYGTPPFVLPMIKVFERGKRDVYEPGLECLRELLRKRFDTVPLEEVFEPDTLDWLLRYSGGHVRNLLSWVRQAAAYSESLPIAQKALIDALSPTIGLYSTSIPNAYWPKLAALELSKDQHIDNNDPDSQAMLEQLYVMEYINGGAHSDPFVSAAPWYAVNPIVRELRQFKDAVDALRDRQ